MDFNKLFGRIRDIDQGKKTVVTESTLKECGAPMGMESNIPHVPPVSMNVNLNAQGIDQIKDLLNLMNKAESPLAPGAVGGDIPPMPLPAVKAEPALNIAPMTPELPPEPAPSIEPAVSSDPLDDIIKKAGIATAPKAEKPAGEEEPAPKDAVTKMADDIRTMTDTLANTPKEEIAGIDAVTATGNDLASKGDEAEKVNGGGNPFQKTESQIKSNLMKLYQEMKEGKAKPDFLDADKDGDKKEPMKKALKDKEVEEGFDSDAKVGDTFKTAKGTATKTATGVKHTRDKYDYDPGSDDKDDKKMKRDAKKSK